MSVIMIACGMEKPKKHSGEINIYLNYGLLGLATNLKEATGFDVRMYQGDYEKPETVMEMIRDPEGYPIFLSVPSFFSVKWALNMAQLLKKTYPENKIVLGGRWVLDNNPEWVKKTFGKLVDFYSFGCPDNTISELLDPEKWSTYENVRQKYQGIFEHFDYTLLHNFREYQPVIEISRGCGMGCSFCVEKNYQHLPYKKPEETIKECMDICGLYGDSDLNFYFESSMFNPCKEWAEVFAKLYRKNRCRFHWRCTTRVDTLNPEVIGLLASAGLKAIDFGLESASGEQLLLMNKTKNPKAYLARAETLFSECCRHGVWVKCNILLYPGLTFSQLAEIEEWITRRKTIKGVSVNPLTLYLNGDVSEYAASLETLSGGKIDMEKLYECGYVYVPLSPEIDSSYAVELAEELTKKLMDRKSFLELKKICYTKRNV